MRSPEANAGLESTRPPRLSGLGSATVRTAVVVPPPPPPHPETAASASARTPIWQDAAAMRLHALRGATTVDQNDAEAIVGATEWLMREIMKRNDLSPDDVVSCIFTLTDDLDAEF